MEVVVSTICKCQFSLESSVLLQVIKALLTLCTSGPLSGPPLVQSLWTLLSIYASATDKVITNTAKGAISQILGTVFSLSLSDDVISRISELPEDEGRAAASKNDALIIFGKFLEMMRRAVKRIEEKEGEKDGERQVFTVADERIRFLVSEYILNILENYCVPIKKFSYFLNFVKKSLSNLLVLSCSPRVLMSFNSDLAYIWLKIIKIFLEIFLPLSKIEPSQVMDTCVLNLLTTDITTMEFKSLLLSTVVNPLLLDLPYLHCSTSITIVI
ncbi:hypothetical protein GEMRC1_013596 [Eukaryota sp. GEM-RC1]